MDGGTESLSSSSSSASLTSQQDNEPNINKGVVIESAATSVETAEERPVGRHGALLSPPIVEDGEQVGKVKKFNVIASGSSDSEDSDVPFAPQKEETPDPSHVSRPASYGDDGCPSKDEEADNWAVSVSENDEEEEEEVSGESEPLLSNNDNRHCEGVMIEEGSLWDSCLLEMDLVDVTSCSSVHTLRESSGDSLISGSLVKVVSLFGEAPPSSKSVTRVAMQAALVALVKEMTHTQRLIEEKELNVATEANDFECVCRGVQSVHLDSKLRLIARIDEEPCPVSLNDVIAFSSASLSQNEVLTILKSIVLKVKRLHEAGMVHGALHGGNVLFSTDDGHCVLTSPETLMSNYVFPSDLSFVPPSRAVHLETLGGPLWQEGGIHQPGRLGSSNALPEEVLLSHSMKVLQSRDGTTGETRAVFSDDVYAIGAIAFSLLIGVPLLHGAKYITAIESLCQLATSCRDGESLRDLLFTQLLKCDYARLRIRQSKYSEDFLDCLELFIVDCMMGAVDVNRKTEDPSQAYRCGGDVFQHPLFRRFPLVNAVGALVYPDTTIPEQLVDMNDIVHRTVYPIYASIDTLRQTSGATPYLVRLHRNSIFASRVEALRASLSTGPTGASDVTLALWPYTNHYGWHTGCCYPRREKAKEFSSADHDATCDMLFPRSIPFFEDEGRTLYEFVEIQSGCKLLPHLRMVLFTDMRQSAVSLRREYVDLLNQTSPTFDILVLKNISNCDISIVSYFKYVVVCNVSSSTVSLGTCFSCLLHHVADCTPLSIACTYLLLDDVENTDLHVSGGVILRASEASSISGASLLPYNLVYSGLSADYARAGLPQEQMSSMTLFHSDPQEEMERGAVLKQIEYTGADFPYSHALAASGNRFIHRDDNESDVFFFFGEMGKRDVWLANINGNECSTSDTAAVHDGLDSGPSSIPVFGELFRRRSTGTAEEQADKVNQSPILFFLDILGDVVVEDCAFCTIFVCGSTGSLIMKKCHHVNFICVGKEVVMEQCEDLTVFALVTEYLEAVQCSRLVIEPLYMSCPHFDQILEAIVDERTMDDTEGETYERFRDSDLPGLNVVECDGRVCVTESVDVVVKSQGWYSENQDSLRSLVSFSTTRDGNPTNSDYFRRFCEACDVDPRQFSTKSFQDLVYRAPQCNASLSSCVRFHDIPNSTILRLNGLAPIFLPRDPTAESHLILERITGGTFHFVGPTSNLYIRHCVGPLDIVVCAAQNVFMEHCENVVVRVACFTFAAQDCHHCHTALHVNTQPKFLRCSSMMLSALNITTPNFDELMEHIGIHMDLNLFDRPLLLEPTVENVLCALEDKYRGESLDGLSGGMDNGPVESLTDAFKILGRQATVVPSLEGLCVGLETVPFHERLEARVVKGEDRPELDDLLMGALLFLASDDDLVSGDADVGDLAARENGAGVGAATRDVLKQMIIDDDASVSADGELRRSIGAKRSPGDIGGIAPRHVDPTGSSVTADTSEEPSASSAEPLFVGKDDTSGEFSKRGVSPYYVGRGLESSPGESSLPPQSVNRNLPLLQTNESIEFTSNAKSELLAAPRDEPLSNDQKKNTDKVPTQFLYLESPHSPGSPLLLHPDCVESFNITGEGSEAVSALLTHVANARQEYLSSKSANHDLDGRVSAAIEKLRGLRV